MKIFSWMQSKLNAKQAARKPNTIVANHHMVQANEKEEFSDWPQSLLAIGTFGISNLKADPERETAEEVDEVQEELTSILDTAESGSMEESETPLEPAVCEELVNRGIVLPRSISRSMNDIIVDQKNNVMRKKSLTFLLKKFFTCKNKYNHSPLVRESLHPTIDKSRMEKMLRAILNKKIHPQSSSAKAMPKKYLVGEDIAMGESDDEIPELEDDYEGSNVWVKTDSEYIVLEI